MIINATSHIIRKIWILFLFIILALIAFVLILMHGIDLETISFPKIKIDRLYIKLDKKLIVNANNIVIAKNTKSSSSLKEIYKTAKYIKYLNSIFKSISLKNVKYNDETVNLLYKDDIFYLDNRYLTLDTKVKFEKNQIILDLKQLILKDENLELKGKLLLDLKNKSYLYRGRYTFLNLDGNIEIKMEDNKIFYRLESEKFATLEPVMKYLKKKVFIEPLARAWIYKKIVAKEYKLNNLEGMYDLKNGDFFPKAIKGSARVKDAIITFHPKVTPAHADMIDIELKNNTLVFKLTNPTYEKQSVKILDIHIYNLLTTKNGIVVNLSSTSLLNKYIHNILKSFNINLPITQYSGKNSSILKMDIKFKPFDINAQGKFIIRNSKFRLDRITLFTKYADIRLDNDKVYINKTNLQYKHLFDLETNGIFNLKNRTYKGTVNINYINIKLKNQNILNIKNLKNQKIKILFLKNKTTIELPNLHTKLIFDSKGNYFLMEDIGIFKNFSDFIKKYNLKNGSLNIFTKDFENYKADLNLEHIKTPLIKDSKRVDSLKLKIKSTPKKIEAYSKDNNLYIKIADKVTVLIKNHDILLDTNSSDIDTNTSLEINGDNSSIIFKDLNTTLLSSHFTTNIEKGNIDFISIYKNSSLAYEKKEESFFLKISKADDTFINTLLKSKIFDNGSFEISAEGIDKNDFTGSFFIKNSTAKDFALFNNIIAAINTIPSLVLFKDPRFNENGYIIKKGTISFQRKNDILYLSKIKLHGFSADISGSGYLDLNSDRLQLYLEITTLKDVSKLIKNIPLVGYIILGKNGKISTRVDIEGNLKNPKVKTHILKDSILSPFNILKRVIESPFKLFN